MADENKGQAPSAEHEGPLKTLLKGGGRRALAIGVTVAILGMLSQFLLGRIYGDEARSLTQAVIGPAQSLAGGIITASSTMIALLLTILSLRSQSNSEFEGAFYDRIKITAWFAALALSASIVFLLVLSIPIRGSETQLQQAYVLYYYLVISSAAVLAGWFVCVVFLLYSAVESVINAVHPDIDSNRTIEEGSQE